MSWVNELAQKSQEEVRQDIIAAVVGGEIDDKAVVTNRNLQMYLTREYVAEVFGLENKKSFINAEGTITTLDKKAPDYAAKLEALMEEGGWKPAPTQGLDREALLLGEGVRPAFSIPVINAKGATKTSGGQGRRSEDSQGTHEEYIAAVRELADEHGVFIGQVEREDGSMMNVVMVEGPDGNPVRFGFPKSFKEKFGGNPSWRNENSVALLQSLGY